MSWFNRRLVLSICLVLRIVTAIDPLYRQEVLAHSTPARSSFEDIDSFDDDQGAAQSLFDLHRDLVNIDSTPDNEHAVGVYLETVLQSLGFAVERQYVRPYSHPLPVPPHHSRFNVFAYPPGNRKAPLLLTSHMDTVPVFYPYTIERDTGRIWGRGSVDDKACVATQIHAALKLRKTAPSLAANVSLLFVVGEEVSGDGMIAANKLDVPWRAVIFGEPTESKLVSGHKGLLMIRITAHGNASHSGYPWLGHSANVGLLRALNTLEALSLPSSEKYGNSTLNIGRIEGGTAGNVIASLATADCSIRVAGGNVTELFARISSALTSIAGEGKMITVEQRAMSYPPVDLDTDVEGFDVITVNYGTDVPNLKGNHKRYLYGPGSILVAHSDHENLYTKDLVSAVRDYERLARAVGAKM